MFRRLSARPWLLATLALAGCAPGPQSQLVLTPVVPTGGLASVELSTGELVTPFDPRAARLEAASLNTAGEVKIRVTTTGTATASLGGATIPSGEWVTLPLSALESGAEVPLEVADTSGHRQTYEVASLPADFPAYTVSANDPTPGLILMSPNAADGAHASYLFAADERGRPVYYKRLPDKGFNFQKHAAPDGSARFSYLQKEGDQLEGVSTFLGTIRLMDGDFQETARLSLLPHGDHGALPADLHEFVYLGDGHYILTSYEGKRVTNVPSRGGEASGVAAAIIQEVQDGQVVFEWDSTEHPEFYDNATDGNDFTNAKAPWADYMHMNAIAIDPADGNMIVSFRHQDQLVKLDRHTGAVLWRLGGKNDSFGLTEAQAFSHQHFGRTLDDGTITLFDNGNAGKQTRLLSFKLDEAAKAVSRFDAATPGDRYSYAMGSYQKLDATTAFVGWGALTRGTTDASETRDGVETFALTFTNPTYESYRALKYAD